MTEEPKRTRWWQGPRRRLVVVLGLAGLLVAGGMAWEHYRLNATEQALVGSWTGDRAAVEKLRFSRGRLFEGTIILMPNSPNNRMRILEKYPHAVWSASPKQIEIRAFRTQGSTSGFPQFRRFASMLFGGGERRSLSLQIDGPDHITVEGHRFHRDPPPRP